MKALKQSVLRPRVLHADATGVLCQENSRSRKTRKAQLWAWLGDKKEVVFDFTLTKEQSRAEALHRAVVRAPAVRRGLELPQSSSRAK